MTTTGSAHAPLRAWVELVHHLDARTWPERHAVGEVPDTTPFGIDQLSGFGVEAVFRTPPSGRLSRKLAREVRTRAGELEWVEELVGLADRRRRNADVVLCWDEFTGIPALAAARLPGSAPVVTGVQMLSDAERRPAAFRRRGRALAAADAVFVQSRAMIDVLHESWGIGRDRLHFVPFGVDPDWFRPDPGAVRPGRVVSVGDDGHRDYDTLVAAMSTVAARRPGTSLEIGTQLPVQLPPGLGTVLRGHLGRRRPAFYASAAVVALAARPNFHGSGMSVILEAMACGRPYVVTDGAGLADYVADGVDGFVVPPGDAGAMADAVELLLADPDRADEMGRAGRSRVEQGLATLHQAQGLARLLIDIAGR